MTAAAAELPRTWHHLRAVVDRLARSLPWLHSGVLTPIELPEPLLLWHHVHPAVSADGEQLIVIGLRTLSPQDLAMPHCNIVRFTRPIGDPQRLIQVPGRLKAMHDEPHGDPLLVAIVPTEDGVERTSVYDLNGRLLKTWETSENAIAYASGWVLLAGTHLVDIRHPDVQYPACGAASAADWVVVRVGGAPRLVMTTNKELRMWDLRSEQLAYKVGRSGRLRWLLYEHMGLVSCSNVHLDTLELLAMETGAALPPPPTTYHAKYVIERLLVFDSGGSLVRYWDPRNPNRISELNFQDWTVRAIDGNNVLVADRGDRVLLWCIHLGRGVVVTSEPTGVRFACGVLILTYSHHIAMIPLFTDQADSASAYATPLPVRVPDDVPLREPRVIYTFSKSFMAYGRQSMRLIAQPTTAPLLSPIFRGQADQEDPFGDETKEALYWIN